MSFTKMMWFFGIKKRNLERITEEARKACSDLRELRCAERLDNAFGTSYTATDISGNYLVTVTGGDGLAFISNSHTREDGGTAWNNRVTDGTTVNMDYLKVHVKSLLNILENLTANLYRTIQYSMMLVCTRQPEASKFMPI